MSQPDMMAKLLIIGNSGVGKTNVLLKFTANTFVMSHITTIGMTPLTKELTSNLKLFWQMVKKLNSKFGTLLARRGSKRLLKLTIKEQKGLFSPMLLTTKPPSILYSCGLNKSSNMPLKIFLSL